MAENVKLPEAAGSRAGNTLMNADDSAGQGSVLRKRSWFRFTDFLVILVFLSTAALGVTLFWRDLFQTLSVQGGTPVGVIAIKKNVVQRRLSDRSLWDRLAVDSAVYPDDLIRVADLSEATLNIESSALDLNENTLIRIHPPQNNEGPVQVELQEGSMSLVTGEESPGLVLNLFGTRVQAGPGTVLNAAAGDDGMVVQVNEGSVRLVRDGQVRELPAGAMIATDPSGTEVARPGVVVTRPSPNARYVKKEEEPFPVSFLWNRVNLEAADLLRLEIAGDRNFTRDFRSFETRGGAAETFEAGLWYWRLVFGDSSLNTGRFTVVDGTGPELISPVADSVFRYHRELPQLRFQWSAKPEVSYYTLEISGTPDFTNIHVSRQVAAVSFIYSSLGPGTWYWRVLPVFFSAYEGSAAYSSAASFRIEQTDDPGAPALELPPPKPDPVSVTTRPVPGRRYLIKPGDTLRRIAIEAYNDASRWKEISDRNSIPNAALIFPGQVLDIP